MAKPILYEDGRVVFAVDEHVETLDGLDQSSLPVCQFATSNDEPVVTRKELWSYYRESSDLDTVSYRLTERHSFPVYYNGDNVSERR
jgi:hypothetical protein